jgi:gamma-glutamyltranspeptidase/glutathione hydrolase
MATKCSTSSARHRDSDSPPWPILDFAPITVDFGETSQIFHIGKGAAAVPGELVGLLALHRRAGRLPLREVVAPAVAWARDGFRASPQIAMIAGLIAPIASHSPTVRRLFLPAERLPRAGDRLANPELGDFLQALGDGSPDAQVATFRAALVEHFGPEHGGLISAEDVAAYAPVTRAPLRIPFGHAYGPDEPTAVGRRRVDRRRPARSPRNSASVARSSSRGPINW